MARLEALAAARRAGGRAGIEALRADAHMGLVDGLFAGLDDDLIVLALVEQHAGGHEADRLEESDPARPAADIVELWVSLAELAGLEELARELAPTWVPVCRDIVARFRAWRDSGSPVPGDDPTRRFPRAALARWVAVRDRSCVGPGCTFPAHGADLDHTVDHARGGPTADANLDAMCQHDHRLKHEGGWTLRQAAPGRFVWTSRCGQRIEVAARPVRRDLPTPSPRADGRWREAPLDLESLADDEGDPTGRTSSAWLDGIVPPWTRDRDGPVDPDPDGSPPTLPAPPARPDEPPPF